MIECNPRTNSRYSSGVPIVCHSKKLSFATPRHVEVAHGSIAEKGLLEFAFRDQYAGGALNDDLCLCSAITSYMDRTNQRAVVMSNHFS